MNRGVKHIRQSAVKECIPVLREKGTGKARFGAEYGRITDECPCLCVRLAHARTGNVNDKAACAAFFYCRHGGEQAGFVRPENVP